MDAESFDHFSRLVANTRSRRSLGGTIVGVLAGVLAGTLPAGAKAHDMRPLCEKIEDPKKRAACRRDARQHRRVHCVSNADCPGCKTCVKPDDQPRTWGRCANLYPLCNATQCTRMSCRNGTWRCVNFCPPSRTCCQGTCFDPCPPGQDRNPALWGDCGCHCPFGEKKCPSVGGGSFCCRECKQCCSGIDQLTGQVQDRCCQPASCGGAFCDSEGYCVGGTSGCPCR